MSDKSVKKRKPLGLVLSQKAMAALLRIAKRHGWTKTLSLATSLISTDNMERLEGLDSPSKINGNGNAASRPARKTSGTETKMRAVAGIASMKQLRAERAKARGTK